MCAKGCPAQDRGKANFDLGETGDEAGISYQLFLIAHYSTYASLMIRDAPSALVCAEVAPPLGTACAQVCLVEENMRLAIADKTYGNVDVRKPLPKSYVHVTEADAEVSLQALVQLCKRVGVKYAKALVGFDKYRGCYKPCFNGVVIHQSALPKLRKALSEYNSPEKVAARQRAREKAKERRERPIRQAGLVPGTQVARWYSGGEMDRFEARLAQYKSYYRHQHTDYDLRFRRPNWKAGETREDVRDEARFLAQEHDEGVEDVEDYLSTYGLLQFTHARKVAETLRNPLEAHPVWFAKACLAMEWDEADPSQSWTYEQIKDTISGWRAGRLDG